MNEDSLHAWNEIYQRLSKLHRVSTVREVPSDLVTAAGSGYLRSIALLLDHGAAIDVGEELREEYSPLQAALDRGELTAARLLLERGASMLSCSDSLVEALSRESGLEALELLLSFGFEPSEDQLAEALQVGVKERDAPLVSRLLVLGALPTDECFETAVKDDEERQDAGSFAAVLRGKGSPDGILPWRKDERSLNDLMLESRREKDGEHLPIIEEKIRRGVLGEHLDRVGPDGLSLLGKAFYHGVFEVADWLLEAGADPNAFNDDGTSPLYLAAGQRDQARLQTLLAAGAEVDGRGDIGRGGSALGVAASLGDIGLVEILLEAGADPVLVDHNGGTPARAARGPFKDLIRRRIEEAASTRGNFALSPAFQCEGRPLKPGSLSKRGACDLMAALSEWESTWVVLAGQGPIAEIAPVLADIRNAELDIDVGGRSVKVAEPESFLFQLVGFEWTLEYRSLGWARVGDGQHACWNAAELSRRLEIPTLVFMGFEASEMAEVACFENGKPSTEKEWPDGADGQRHGAIEAFFLERGIYLPAAFPNPDGLVSRFVFHKIGPETVARLDRLRL